MLRRVVVLLLAVLFTVASVAVYAQVTSSGTNRSMGDRFASDRGRPWSTYGSKTDTSTLALQAAPGANVRVYLYEAYCVNVSASTAGVALIKYSTTTVTAINCSPANKAVVPTTFNPPLGFPANTGVTMNSVGSVTTMHLFAEGTTAP